MSATTQKEYPSLAEIVRQETDGGRLIVQFYLGVAYGDIQGFRDHHRAAAARRIDKIAPDLVKEYLHKYHNDACRDYFARSLFPMGRIEPRQKADPVPRGPNAFQRRLRQIVRKETDDGRNIVLFLIGVMDGTLTGFKPHHRLEAARELASYITSSPSPSTGEGWGEGDSPAVATKPATQNRDNTPVVPAKAEPAPYSIRGTQRGLDGRGSHSPSPSTREHTTPVVPAKAEPAPYSIRGTQRGVDGRGSHSPSPSTRERNTPVVPAEAGTQRGGAARGSSPSPSTGEGRGEGDSPGVPTKPDFPPITIEELERFDFTREHAAQYNFARDEITGGIYGYDELGPFVADEEGEIHHIDPSRVAGYERAVRRSPATPEPSATRSGRDQRGSRPSQARNSNPKTRRSPHPRTLNRRRKNLNTPARDLKPGAYPVRPEPVPSRVEGPVEGPPGRSPPKIWV